MRPRSFNLAGKIEHIKSVSRRAGFAVRGRKLYFASLGGMPKLRIWNKFKERFTKRLKQKRVECIFKEQSLQFAFRIGGKRAAVMEILLEVDPVSGKSYLVIDQIQGIDGWALLNLTNSTGRSWGSAITDSVIGAAYESGCSGVKLLDYRRLQNHADKIIPFNNRRVTPFKRKTDAWLAKRKLKIHELKSKRATAEYKRMLIAKAETEATRRLRAAIGRELRPQMRAEIKNTYMKVVEDCGFNKFEGEYYVREFP